jgi:putative hydrolase of the HAD superfamily
MTIEVVLFDDLYFSHEMGHVKPDRAAFDHVVTTLDCAPEHILFLDDNQINVDGARAAGLVAERAVGVEAARSILTARHLV